MMLQRQALVTANALRNLAASSRPLHAAALRDHAEDLERAAATEESELTQLRVANERLQQERDEAIAKELNSQKIFIADVRQFASRTVAAELALGVAREAGLKLGIVREILTNELESHPEGCSSEFDSCLQCKEEYDSHSYGYDGQVCFEFVGRPCDCSIKDVLEIIGEPSKLAEAVQAVMVSVVLDAEMALDALCALAQESWK